MAVTLPTAPRRIARLPKDERGYPVPAFVEWIRDGEAAKTGAPGARPDFRYANFEFRERAWRQGLCWICGDPLGRHRVYAIGPMCVVNRTTMEPPSHRDCAEFAAKACPFLVRPRMRRLPEAEGDAAPGTLIKRNPGCVCLYETSEAKRFGDGRGGWLIRLGEPERVDWWAEGRTARREEILASLESGLPLLQAEAQKDGGEALEELEAMTGAAIKLLPA
jgi:hypothetical protein